MAQTVKASGTSLYLKIKFENEVVVKLGCSSRRLVIDLTGKQLTGKVKLRYYEYLLGFI